MWIVDETWFLTGCNDLCILHAILTIHVRGPPGLTWLGRCLVHVKRQLVLPVWAGSSGTCTTRWNPDALFHELPVLHAIWTAHYTLFPSTKHNIISSDCDRFLLFLVYFLNPSSRKKLHQGMTENHHLSCC